MKITFNYSRTYDEMLTSMSGLEYDEFQEVNVKSYINELETFWNKNEKKILEEIERVSGLKFKNSVECYVVKNMSYAAFSHPFTLRVDESFDNVKATIIHELIHILLVQNGSLVMELLNKKFKDARLKVHLPVMLIFKNVIKNLYGEQYLEKVLEVENDRGLERIWKVANSVNFNKNLIAYLER